MLMDKQEGSVSVILAGVFGLLFLITAFFGIWAFAGRQDYKNNVDEKIEKASAIAVEQAKTAKDAEFVEKEKLPNRTYTGSETYGSLTFSYPKTWSVYSEEGGSGKVLSMYAFPSVVPGMNSEQNYALRVEISTKSYDSELKSIQQVVERGDAKSTAFRLDKVPSVLGVRVDGEIINNKQGSMVILPLRDKTIKIYTELPQFTNDFNNTILPSVSFVP